MNLHQKVSAVRSLTAAAAVAVTLGFALAAAPAQAAATAGGGSYHVLASTRILDTRSGLGLPAAGRAGPNSTTTLTVLGRAGVPATNVAAVVFNLTAVSPTRGSYLTAFPAGPNRPVVSNLNVDAGVTRANQVTVPVGTGGAVSLYNAFGSVDLLADVLGYYDSTNGTSGGLIPLVPGRIFDSRTPEDGPALSPNEVVSAGLTLDDPAMDPHTTALSVNITAINADAGGYLSTWDGAAIQPTTSTVNFGAHDNVPNAAIVPVAHVTGSDGKNYSYFKFKNLAPGSTHVAVDIVGVYVDGQVFPDLRYTPITPTRVLDTRSGLGGLLWFGPGETKGASVPGALITGDTYGMAGNVTAVTPTASTYLSIWSQADPQPYTSTVNSNPRRTVANAAFVDTDYNVFNASGRTDVLVDVSGRFDSYAGPAAKQSASGSSAGAATLATRTATRMPHNEQTRH